MSVPVMPVASRPAMMDYSNFQSALLVGEADFSFTAAFCQTFQGSITATEYATGADILQLYHDGCPTFLNKLAQQPNVEHIMASVDAKLLGSDCDTCTCSRWNAETQSFDTSLKSFWETLQHHKTPLMDIIIFNCPHTNKHGKAPLLLRLFFQQIRLCLYQGRVAPHVVVELRLRDLGQLRANSIRVDYQHEHAAHRSHFQLVGVYDNDVPYWETLGYEHRQTRRKATCRGLPCHVWRWRYNGDSVDGDGDADSNENDKADDSENNDKGNVKQQDEP